MGLPKGWQGPEYLSHHVLPPWVCISRKSYDKWEWGLNPGTQGVWASQGVPSLLDQTSIRFPFRVWQCSVFLVFRNYLFSIFSGCWTHCKGRIFSCVFSIVFLGIRSMLKWLKFIFLLNSFYTILVLKLSSSSSLSFSGLYWPLTVPMVLSSYSLQASSEQLKIKTTLQWYIHVL